MAKVERIHEILASPLTPDYLQEKAREGWRPVAVVWERTVEGEDAEPGTYREVPFGMQVADDCQHLMENSVEVTCMRLMLKLIIEEHPFSRVAIELNRNGFRTRQGSDWSETSVFNMLPRLIEVAPQIYASQEWTADRPDLRAAV